MSTEEFQSIQRIAVRYVSALFQGDWAKLRETLSSDVEFEDPRTGQINGLDTHMALYIEEKRFPDLRGVAIRSVANNDDMAIVSYDVYLGTRRKVAVVDHLSVRDDRIVRVLAVTSEWPPLELE